MGFINEENMSSPETIKIKFKYNLFLFRALTFMFGLFASIKHVLKQLCRYIQWWVFQVMCHLDGSKSSQVNNED